jgi:hypothetical protein
MVRVAAQPRQLLHSHRWRDLRCEPLKGRCTHWPPRPPCCTRAASPTRRPGWPARPCGSAPTCRSCPPPPSEPCPPTAPRRRWPRRPHRRAQHRDPLGREDGVEGGSELRVPVAEQEPEATDTVFELHEQVAGLLRHPVVRGMRRHPSTWTRRLATSSTNRTYSRCRKTVSTVKKSAFQAGRTTCASSGGATGARVQQARLGLPSSPAAGSPRVAAPRPRGAA